MTQHEKIVQALTRLGVRGWTVNGDKITYEEGATKPTKAEINAEIAYMESPAYEVDQWRQTFTVELYKLKIALETKGDLVTVENIIASQPKQVQIAWNNTPTVRRNSPTVASLAIAMQYSDEVLDQLFKDADEVVL